MLRILEDNVNKDSSFYLLEYSATGGQTPSRFGRKPPAPSCPPITLLRPHNLQQYQ